MLDPLPAVAPDTPLIDTVQEKVVPPVKLLRLIPVFAPEHIVWLVGVAEANGTGFTVIVTVIGVPAQPLAVGMIV
jgi:hypothetical protein